MHNTRVVDKLKLKPLREINMEISSFLSKKEEVMKLKEYELNVKISTVLAVWQLNVYVY